MSKRSDKYKQSNKALGVILGAITCCVAALNRDGQIFGLILCFLISGYKENAIIRALFFQLNSHCVTFMTLFCIVIDGFIV